MELLLGVVLAVVTLGGLFGRRNQTPDPTVDPAAPSESFPSPHRKGLALGMIVALVVGLSAGAAYGYFSSSGSGSGAANVGTAGTVTVVAATDTPSTPLIPGGTADLTFTIDNPNSYAVRIVSVAQNGPVTVVGGTGCTSDSGSEPSLTLGNSGVSVPSQSGLSISVASGSGQKVHLGNGASMDTSSASGCQGARFQIPVTITVEQP